MAGKSLETFIINIINILKGIKGNMNIKRREMEKEE